MSPETLPLHRKPDLPLPASSAVHSIAMNLLFIQLENLLQRAGIKLGRPRNDGCRDHGRVYHRVYQAMHSETMT
jgi:hypothetical protein